MGQVAELERKWRETAVLMDSASIPWDDVKSLSEAARELGAELLEAPAADLGELAIKVQWLADHELDRESLELALRNMLADIRHLQRQ